MTGVGQICKAVTAFVRYTALFCAYMRKRLFMLMAVVPLHLGIPRAYRNIEIQVSWTADTSECSEHDINRTDIETSQVPPSQEHSVLNRRVERLQASPSTLGP